MMSNGSKCWIKKRTTEKLKCGEQQTMDELLICSKSNSNYECPLH